jgi:hypothetical protein
MLLWSFLERFYQHKSFSSIRKLGSSCNGCSSGSGRCTSGEWRQPGELALNYVSSCKLPIRTPKLVAWIRIKGLRLAIRRLVVLVGLDRLSISKILIGCLSNIFGFSYFYNIEKEICMYDIFNFYAATVKYSCGSLHTVRLFTWGLGFMVCSNETLYFSFINTMLMQ